MIQCVSTFKPADYNDDVNDNNTCATIKDMTFQTSTFGILNPIDDCEKYYDFLDEMDKLYAKVESGDFSDFTE